MRLTFRNRRILLLLVLISSLSCLYHLTTFYNRRSSENKLTNTLFQNEFEFQKIMESSSVPIFLVEPRRLINLLSNGDVLLLRRREIYFRSLSRSDYLTTYGTFEESSIRINKMLIKKLRSYSYSYSKTEALDAREFHWYEKKHRDIVLTTHHFFVKRDHVFHLMVFYNRRTFLWTSSVFWLPSIVSHLVKKEDLLLGGHAAAFEKFQVVAVKERNANYFVRVPSDITQFLSEIPSSKFLECNHKIARQFYATNWENSKPNKGLDYATASAINAMKNVLKPFLIPFWITSGTLLGWYRQCDVIPYTSDIDLSGWARDIDSALDSHVMNNREALILRVIYGIHWESYQYVFTFYNLRVDFFFTYKDEKNYWYGGHGPGDEIFFHYNYPKFTLCSGELVGQKVLVPCNPEDVISAEYGNDWHIPVEYWNYAYSAFNIGTKFKWPKELINKTHIYL